MLPYERRLPFIKWQIFDFKKRVLNKYFKFYMQMLYPLFKFAMNYFAICKIKYTTENDQLRDQCVGFISNGLNLVSLLCECRLNKHII